MTRARSPPASNTARSSASFSSSVVVGDSPVVPDTTRPSQPASTRWVASRAAAPQSSEPSGPNGVTIAVSTVPRRALTSKPLVVTATKITWPGSGLGGQRRGGDLGAVGEGGDLEVGEHRRRHIGELAQAGDREAADLDVGVLAGPHRDEVPPRPVVAGHDDAGLGRIGQHRARRLAGLLAAPHGVA